MRTRPHSAAPNLWFLEERYREFNFYFYHDHIRLERLRYGQPFQILPPRDTRTPEEVQRDIGIRAVRALKYREHSHIENQCGRRGWGGPDSPFNSMIFGDECVMEP